MPIPAWTAKGVIAPIDIFDPVSPDRSPYPATLAEVVQRFATTTERCEILSGYFSHRAALHAAGLTSGFQWLDGSFLEDIETISSRAPQDIDVVTYFSLPAGMTQAQVLAANPALFPADAPAVAAFKAQYRVDAYEVDLQMPPVHLVMHTTYWYSMWSHRRNEDWKGYVQVDLAPGEDAGAIQDLHNIAANLAQPQQPAANVGGVVPPGAGP